MNRPRTLTSVAKLLKESLTMYQENEADCKATHPRTSPAYIARGMVIGMNAALLIVRGAIRENKQAAKKKKEEDKLNQWIDTGFD